MYLYEGKGGSKFSFRENGPAREKERGEEGIGVSTVVDVVEGDLRRRRREE